MAINPLTTNVSGIVAGATAASSLVGLVMAIPLSSNPAATKGYQPLNTPQSSGLPSLSPLPTALLFHYEGENNVVLQSDITDHFVENNIAIQDQIALKPEEISTEGFIGELNNVVPSFLLPLQSLANTLVTIDGYTPALSATALNAYNQAIFLYDSASSVAQSAVGAWSSISSAFGGGGSEINGSGVFSAASSFAQNKQQAMFTTFYGYYYSKTLFNVQTPWAIFTNMAIKTLTAIQDPETRMISTFKVTFKKIRTAQTLSLAGGLISQGRAATQSATATNNGTSSGTPGSSLGGNIATTEAAA